MRAGFAVALMGAVSGCTLVTLRSESHSYYTSAVLAGRVLAGEGWQGGVAVAAVRADGAPTPAAHRVWLHEAGGYELIVPPGRYVVQAFADADGDGAPDCAMPLSARSAPMAVRDSGLLLLADLVLAPGACPSPPGGTEGAIAPYSTQAGAVSGIDSPLFSSEWGRRGYWAPMETFRQLGGNVHFLAPYDPARTPVLFVHGALGAGQDWRDFVDALGADYQPWLFQYPSGASMESMSSLLYWKLLNLKQRYGFTRLHLVAHSMGGLLVRRFLLDHGEQFPEIGLFVSISTPWSGDARARLGVAYSPAVVPSWRDMQPEGGFLRDLFRRPLPGHVRHALLFGYRGASLLDGSGGDGVVTLASQRRVEAEKQAWLVAGYDEDHVGILSAPAVHAHVAGLLDDADARRAAAAASLRLSVLGADARAPGDPAPVVLLSDDSSRRTRLLVSPGAVGAADYEVRHLPAGRYRVELLVPGHRTLAGAGAVSLQPGETAQATFHVAPQGLLWGQLQVRASPHALPAGISMQAGEALVGAQIELDGPQARRRLRVEELPDLASLLSTWASGRDAAAGPWFGFAGLPAGTYRVTVRLEGHAPACAEFEVTPGRAAPVATMSLAGPARAEAACPPAAVANAS